ncbi:hypothetical protein REPUB_Repub15cG0070800 [Reevesia pubescens]
MQHGVTSVVLELDSSLAIHEISKGGSSYWDEACLTMEILRPGRMHIKCGFMHVRRQANLLAHALAKVDCEPGCQRLWLDSLPFGVCNSDCLVSN